MSDELIIRWYDEAVGELKDAGRKVADGIDAVIKRVEHDPDAVGVPPASELRAAWITATIRSERDSRAKRRMPLFQQVSDALSGNTIMGDNDPVLDIALRTGTSDGLDKLLRYFAVEDWLSVLGASAENVAAAIESDKELRNVVNPIIAAYARSRGSTLEQVLADHAP